MEAQSVTRAMNKFRILNCELVVVVRGRGGGRGVEFVLPGFQSDATDSCIIIIIIIYSIIIIIYGDEDER